MNKILILKTGSTFPELKRQKGDFEDWIIARSSLPQSRFQICNLEEKVLHKVDLQTIKAALITGSHAMVTERPLWLKKAISLIEEMRARCIPLMGICFGHQLIAAAFGGKVADNPRGAEYGAVEIRLSDKARTDRLFSGLPHRFNAFMSHKQTVMQSPPGAVRLAQSPLDRHAAFFLPPNIWGVQFHPEFDESIMRFYLTRHFKVPPGRLNLYLKDTAKASSIIRLFLSASLHP
ncbi:glutamine amidotransferase [Calditrichota bacterium GD2]